MTPFTTTITVPDWCPAVAGVALTPPTVPPEVAGAAGASGAGKAGKRGGMTADERRKRERIRKAAWRAGQSGTNTGQKRDNRGTNTGQDGTREGGLGGGCFDSETPKMLEIKAEIKDSEEQHTPKQQELRAKSVPLCPAPVPLSHTGQTGQPQEPPMTTPVTNADIIAAWPESAGGGISDYHVKEATRAICINQACTPEVARAFLLKRIQSYKAGSWVETTEPKYRASWKTWLKEDALGPEMPVKWFQRNPAAAPSKIGKGRGDGWGGDAAARAMGVKP